MLKLSYVVLLSLSTLLRDYTQEGVTITNSNTLKESNRIVVKAPVYTSELDKSLGIGEFEYKGVSNNRSYEWYIDQSTTGYYSNINCGPSSVTMALKWVDIGHNKSVARARESNSSGGWWYDDIVEEYLVSNNTIPDFLYRINQDTLVDTLSEGSIIIVALDTSYIKYNNNIDEHVGKFYDYNGGHYIIIKGYKYTDKGVYFECYDPNSYGKKYKNGELKGKDRYYEASELVNAIYNHSDSVLIVQPK